MYQVNRTYKYQDNNDFLKISAKEHKKGVKKKHGTDRTNGRKVVISVSLKIPEITD